MKIKQTNVLLSSLAALSLTVSVGCIWPFAGGEPESTNGKVQNQEAQRTDAEQSKEQTQDQAQEDQESEEDVTEQVTSEEARADAEKRYPVSGIKFSYLNEHPDLPSLKRLRNLNVPLKKTSWGYGAPGEQGTPQKYELQDILQGEEPVMFSGAAIRILNNAIVQWFNEQDLISVYANPDPQHISKSGEDLRPSGETVLRIILHVAPVGRVKTIASGSRFPGDNKINRPEHAWIRKQSPLQPGDADRRADLMRQDLLDRYIYYLNRHPGRRVEATLGDAGDGKASLGYRISEQKPWTIYAQVSNTGTENTSEIQERVGFAHNQLTGNDDILSLDYTTSGFGDDFNDLRTSYERPFFPGSRTKFKVRGFYNEFTSTDVGIFDLDFEGEEYGAGASVIDNIYQSGRWFLDLEGGAEFATETNTNKTLGVEGEADFLRPKLTLSLERSGRTANTNGSLSVKHNLDSVAGTEQEDVDLLGRRNAEPGYTVANLRFSQNFFIEPILFGEGWADPSTPGTSTQAHEIQLTARGQFTGDRLISGETFLAGGMYTVRGYPESVASGDTGYIGSFEYRFHVPRVLPVNKDQKPARFLGQPFRLTPDRVFGFPDWDLVLIGFVDYAKTMNENTTGVNVSADEELMSAGVGTEILLRQNFRGQLFWGQALEDLENGEAESGDSEIHFLLQLSY